MPKEVQCQTKRRKNHRSGKPHTNARNTQPPTVTNGEKKPHKQNATCVNPYPITLCSETLATTSGYTQPITLYENADHTEPTSLPG